MAANMDYWMPIFAGLDRVRQAQGEILGLFGFGPAESTYEVIASGARWRLRCYGGPAAGPCLVIVPAPIKRPYIWDVAPSVSAVRYCLRQGVRAYLIEWAPPSRDDGDAGLDEYADRSIAGAVVAVSEASGGAAPFLIGHSLGGTFAAIYTALHKDSVRGLVLLGAPLCFRPGISRFRDALVSMAPTSLSEGDAVPGSLVSLLSAMASPGTFIWSRMIDATRSIANPQALDINARIERWAMDEVPLPARLVHQVLQWLYREDRFCQGTLPIRDRVVGPAMIQLPTLAVVNAADEVAPPASVIPFINAMPGDRASLIEYPGETGVSLQHLGLLVGPRARARLWPEIVAWINAHD